ncbi:MAG TPA: phage tail sheath subtilisin-like domain-containing protein, partial [Pyrinomonadaceae bacterium]
GSVTAAGLREFDTVWLSNVASPADSPPGTGGTYVARFSEAEQGWRFTQAASSTAAEQGSDVWLNAGSDPGRTTLDPANGDELRVVTLAVTVFSADGSSTDVWENVAPDGNHKSIAGAPDGLASLFQQEPNTMTEARTVPIVVLTGSGLDTGREVLEALVNSGLNPGLVAGIDSPDSTDAARSVEFLLAGGNDGQRPTAAEYEGAVDADTNAKTGLKMLEDLEDISIVAAPGSTDDYAARRTQADAAVKALISHAERMRYRIAVLDSGENQSISEVREMRAKLDSSYAALYYPWVRVLDPVTNTERNLPPSGFVAGIYARNDVNRAVYKAPANEVVNLAVGFEKMINRAQQEVLNPEGVNCFRYFEGRGMRLWGARTISSDPEWKYVNLRRYFAYLERSIDKGTQWAVFEPNGPRLWDNVRSTVADFLLNEWTMGALLGDKPERAYFVRCDRSTMTQNDLDNGRLVCLVGVAPLRPAEFVIFRIGQWTADRKV